jgi:hypothetical protein
VDKEMMTMKKKIVVSLFVLALVAPGTLWLTGCTEEELIDIALANEFAQLHEQNSASEVWDDTTTVDLAEEVENALAGTDYSRSDITKAVLNGASYGVDDWTEPATHPDWTIGGRVTVQRIDGTPGAATELFDYSGVSVKNSLGQKITVDLNPPAVDVINDALEDFVMNSTSRPVLQFVTSNESVDPSPSATDRIIFDWVVWIRYQVVVPRIVETFDPLP